MSAAAESLVKEYGPVTAYDRSLTNYPSGLCTSCHRALYKIKAKQPVKMWAGPRPPSWAGFKIDAIFGARSCGSPDQKGELRMCDICAHVRSNPIGSKLSKKEANKPKVLQPRGTKDEAPEPKALRPPNRCGVCLGEKRPGVAHPCGPAAKKQNLLGLIQNSPEKDQKEILGSTVQGLAGSGRRVPTSRLAGEEVKLGKVGGGHSMTMTVGKVDTKCLTTATFWRIEVETDMARNSLLKLKKILGKEVAVESYVREGLRCFDKLGAEQCGQKKNHYWKFKRGNLCIPLRAFTNIV